MSRKPGFTPPGPVIGAVWSVLEITHAVGGYCLLRARHSQARAMAMAGAVMTLGGYLWLFFNRRLAAVTSALMLASARVTAIAAHPVDRRASAMTMPLVGWLAVLRHGAEGHSMTSQPDAVARLGHATTPRSRRAWLEQASRLYPEAHR